MAVRTVRAGPKVQASGRARASSRSASSAEAPGGERAEEHVGQVVVAGGDTTNVINSGYSRQATSRGRRRTSRDIGTPTMSAKQTCIDGTAA